MFGRHSTWEHNADVPRHSSQVSLYAEKMGVALNEKQWFQRTVVAVKNPRVHLYIARGGGKFSLFNSSHAQHLMTTYSSLQQGELMWLCPAPSPSRVKVPVRRAGRVGRSSWISHLCWLQCCTLKDLHGLGLLQTEFPKSKLPRWSHLPCGFCAPSSAKERHVELNC